jgi:hypothetical protein
LNDYHYRIKQLDENILKLLLEKTGQCFIEKNKDKIQFIAVDDKGKALILGCETGKAYASEIKMLNQILNKVDFIKGLPFIADKGYDSISVIQKILDIGLIPAIKMKEAFRVKIKHPLRQLSKNMAKKLAIAWAILWNFYMILIYVFLFILLVLIFRRYFFDFWNRLSG